MKDEEEEEETEFLVYISSRFLPTSIVSGYILDKAVPRPALGTSQSPPHGPCYLPGHPGPVSLH